jgi:hypothetical protein
VQIPNREEAFAITLAHELIHSLISPVRNGSPWDAQEHLRWVPAQGGNPEQNGQFKWDPMGIPYTEKNTQFPTVRFSEVTQKEFNTRTTDALNG